MTGLKPAHSPEGLPVQPPGSAIWQRTLQVSGYLYAVAIPWLVADLSFHLNALRGMRLALNFCSIAAAAAFFGIGPAVVATLTSAVAFNVYLAPLGFADASSHPGDGLIRTGVILLTGGLIALIIKQRYDSERQVRQVLRELTEQADALMQAQQASRSAAWTFSTATRHTRWYPGGAEIFGRPHAEITAMGSPTSLVLEEDRPKISEAAAHTIKTGQPFIVEFRILWPDGEERWLEARGVPLASDPKIWRGATIDITDRKRAEAAMVRSEKLAAAGRLAASIAHEINNPLEAVTNLCYLSKLTSTNPESTQYIEMAEAELSRIAQITSQTLRFHRQQSAAMQIDFGETVEATLKFYSRKLVQSGILVEFEAEPVEPFLCFAGEMRQVVANLVANAADAMPNGGRLRLRLRTVTDWRTGLSSVRLTIADTGHGMSPETKKRIFEPFFTTRGEVGTGLGLWVTSGIVEKHHGTLRVRSSTGPQRSGSVFVLIFPYSSQTPTERRTAVDRQVPATVA